MKLFTILVFLTIPALSWAIKCDRPEEVKYHCTSDTYDLCVAPSQLPGVKYRLQVVSHDPRQGSISFEDKAKVSENRRSLRISKANRLLFIKLSFFDLRLDKRSLRATFKYQDFNIGIGDGPHHDASVPLTHFQCEELK
jgi:hypothetical protein